MNIDAVRRRYRIDMGCCCCGGRASEVHEIMRGADRQAAVHEIATWLAVCRKHHDGIQNWSVEKQLCLKLIADEPNFNLQLANTTRKRDPDSIVILEVLEHIEEVKKYLGLEF